MNKDLKRTIEKLERQVGVAGSETKLRALVRWFGGDEEAHLRALRGYEQKLGQALGEDHTITWEGFQLLGDLLDPSHHASPEAWRKGAPAEPGLPSPPAGWGSTGRSGVGGGRAKRSPAEAAKNSVAQRRVTS